MLTAFALLIACTGAGLWLALAVERVVGRWAGLGVTIVVCVGVIALGIILGLRWGLR